MDSNDRGPEEQAEQGSGARARTARLAVADFLLTINPVDGSEVEPCRPGGIPGLPGRRSAEARAGTGHAAVPPAPVGETENLPLLAREEERERLLRLLTCGRSVRLTGPAGSGRTRLLDVVADDCAGLAPDGVVRLSGYRRTPTDLLHELFAAVYDAPPHRPRREQLLEGLAGIGAVVVLDDIEFGCAALEELLTVTPECAFLIAATPDVQAPSPDSYLEEILLSGISRTACLELLEHAVQRPLGDDETDWAAELWSESDGLPLRFVQAGALLRQRDAATDGLPELPVGTLTAGRLAEGLSARARETLRFAVALGGELPHRRHLPALLDDPHADAAMPELVGAGLATPAGAHYRLSAGVAVQLAAEGYGEDATERVRSAVRHYTWWVGHPSVTPGHVTAEAEVLLAVVQGAQRAGQPSAAVLLAHTAAPVFALAPWWSAWERVLRGGEEAARLAGEVAEEAYFHHELGVLALCTGSLERARAELEASTGLRDALADRRGVVVGRRALVLVTDLSGSPADPGHTAAKSPSSGPPNSRREESAAPPATTPSAPDPPGTPAAQRDTAAAGRGKDGADRSATRRPAVSADHRNVAAVGAGVLLAAVLGVIVTLGSAPDGADAPADRARPDRSASQPEDGDGLPAARPPQNAADPPSPGPGDVADGSRQEVVPPSDDDGGLTPGDESPPSDGSPSPASGGTSDGSSSGSSGGESDGGTSSGEGVSSGGESDGGTASEGGVSSGGESDGGTASEGGVSSGGESDGGSGYPSHTASGTPLSSSVASPTVT